MGSSTGHCFIISAVHINDICANITNANVHLCADDTTINCSAPSLAEALVKRQEYFSVYRKTTINKTTTQKNICMLFTNTLKSLA